MNTILAIALLGSFGLENFTVDPNATIIDYRQSPTSLTTEGTDFLGGTLGGYFITPQNYRYVNSLGILASISSPNPNTFFTIELYSGDSLDLVGIYEASTESLPPPQGSQALPLTLVQSGPGTMSDIRGMQLTWLGEGAAVELTIENLVDMNPPIPKITSYGFEPAGFTIRWTGTGSSPVSVQRTSDLKTGPWVTIASNITTQEYSDPSTPAGKAFYKVVIP
jgi:hypothetical protein